MDNHHGERNKRRTVTAKAVREYNTEKARDENKISVLVSVDLSAAYDSVDNKILEQKLEHYGIRDKELDLIASFLSDRYQYIELETFKSELIESPNCSVIQGSKIAGILYNIYTNEIPKLQELLTNEMVMNELAKTETIVKEPEEHEVVTFVDDTNAIINFKDPEEINEYINKYFQLLVGFFNMSKLKINEEKTTMIIFNQPKHDNKIKDVKITTKADEEDVVPKEQVKILGYLTNTRNSDLPQVNSIISMSSNMLNTALKISKYMSEECRQKFVSSYI